MPKVARAKPSVRRVSVPKKPLKVDDELTGHLKAAEDHLVRAVELFLSHKELNRRVGYLTRLVGAQEAITSLYREELLRIRGPQRPKK